MTPAAAPSRERGFTLVEILVALTIAALVLLPLLRGFSAALDGAADSEAYEQAVVVAESALETMGTTVPLADGQDFERQDGRFRIAAAIRRHDVGDATGYVVPYELSVVVSWGDGRRSRRVALQTLRLGAQQ
jgi:prepilin-type N-terminal cleavage/methylation domain-containing protein